MVWDILSTDVVARTPRFDVIKERVRLPSGQDKDVYMTRQNDAVTIMPVTVDGQILLLNEYRHACRSTLLSLTGGHLDEGDTPLQAAQRELLEETGYTADRFEFVQSFFSDPPRTSRQLHFFIAHHARQTGQQALIDGEAMEPILMSPQDLLVALQSGQIVSLPHIGLMYLGLQKLGFL